jgi:NitT/TauT family transport system substrate-binding protein
MERICSASSARRWRLALACTLGLSVIPGAARGADALHMRLDWSWWGMHSAFLIAEEKGFYDEVGLDVTIEQGQGSKTTTLLVGEAESPVGHVNLSTAAQSIAAGVPITAVAGIAQQGPIGLICDADTNVAKPADVKGLKIGSTPSGSDAQVLPTFLRNNGLAESDVQIVNMQGDAKFAALMSEQVDCISGDIPFYAPQVEGKGKATANLVFAEWGVPNLAYGLIVNDEFLKSNPDVVRRWVAASLRGVEYAFEHIDEAVDLFFEKTGNTQPRDQHVGILEYYKNSTHTENSQGKPFGWMAAEDWAGMLAALGITEEKPVEAYYTNEFLPAS